MHGLLKIQDPTSLLASSIFLKINDSVSNSRADLNDRLAVETKTECQEDSLSLSSSTLNQSVAEKTPENSCYTPNLLQEHDECARRCLDETPSPDVNDNLLDGTSSTLSMDSNDDLIMSNGKKRKRSLSKFNRLKVCW